MPRAPLGRARRSAARAQARPRCLPVRRFATPLQTLLVWNRTNQFLSRCQRRYGPVFTIRAEPWGRAVHINDAAMIKEIFTGDPNVFHAGEGNSMLAPVLGKSSVLVLDEDEHLRARKRLLPPFHGDAVRRYGEVIERIVTEECARWPVGRPFALHPRTRALTFEVILKAVIGVTDPVREQALREVLPTTVDLDFVTLLMWVYPCARSSRALAALSPRRGGGQHAAARGDRRAAHRPGAGRARGRALTAGAGGGVRRRGAARPDHDAAARGPRDDRHGLAWAFERLLRHPRSLARAREGDDEYLDAVARETLRVRPVIPAVLRQLQEPVELGAAGAFRPA